MRILLIQPPYDLYPDDERQAMPPLGLAYIAAALEPHGHAIRIIDCVVEDFQRVVPLPDGRRRHGLDGADLVREIRAFRPDLVGVSCLFSAQSPAAHHVCALVKQADPGIKTIMGGAHPSAVPEEVLEDRNVDFAAIGEGEMTMRRLVEALESRQPFPEDPAGLAFRCPDGALSINKLSKYHEVLDELPLPARHLLKMERYFAYRSPHGGIVKRHPVTNMITSRGCPAQCTFCSIHTVWGRKFRWHSTQRVIDEIRQLVEVYGVREIQFEDDNITMHKPRMAEICQAIIDAKMDITWTTPNGVAIWALDDHLLELMYRAGCYHITLAVESGSQEVLKKIINKPLNLDRVMPIVRTCRRIGMGISAFFVVGFPGETKEDLRKTFEYAMMMDADHAHFFNATPYPGTPLFDQLVESGQLTRPVDYTQLRIGRPLINTPEWTADELLEMTRAAQARFYRRSALRHPLRFSHAALSKLLREPRLTLRKARDTFLPKWKRCEDSPVEPLTASCQPSA
jgi:magnesium-protoporphyrin IX monomethyl ester (oxidative) cyclase